MDETPKGARKAARTAEGEEWAKGILCQLDSDIHSEAGREVDMHPRAAVDPVYRALRRQARQGVGNDPEQLPTAALNALADRAWGKVVDRVKLATSGERPFEGETDEQLRERLAALTRALGPTKEGV